jgi:hypothetical protein
MIDSFDIVAAMPKPLGQTTTIPFQKSICFRKIVRIGSVVLSDTYGLVQLGRMTNRLLNYSAAAVLYPGPGVVVPSGAFEGYPDSHFPALDLTAK